MPNSAEEISAMVRGGAVEVENEVGILLARRIEERRLELVRIEDGARRAPAQLDSSWRWKKGQRSRAKMRMGALGR